MRTVVIGVMLVLAVGSPVAAQSFSADRQLRLSFNSDGTVNLVARNVTARDILLEWGRRCQCHVINAEQLTGGAIMLPLQFEHAAQSAVLESLLRQAAGYVLTPKRAGAPTASNYETIYILATSNPVATAYAPPPTPSVVATPGAPDDELPPVVPIPMQGAAPARQAPPQSPASSSAFPSRANSPFVSITPVPGSAAAPGTVVTPGTAGAPGNVQPGGVIPSSPTSPGTVPSAPGTPAGPIPPGTGVRIVPAPQSQPR
jgi:hypothetical protein